MKKTHPSATLLMALDQRHVSLSRKPQRLEHKQNFHIKSIRKVGQNEREQNCLLSQNVLPSLEREGDQGIEAHIEKLFSTIFKLFPDARRQFRLTRKWRFLRTVNSWLDITGSEKDEIASLSVIFDKQIWRQRRKGGTTLEQARLRNKLKTLKAGKASLRMQRERAKRKPH